MNTIDSKNGNGSVEPKGLSKENIGRKVPPFDPLKAERHRRVVEDVRQDKAKAAARAALPPIPPVSEGEECKIEYLLQLSDILGNQYRQKQTITWSQLGRKMRDETGLRWDDKNYSALVRAVYILAERVAKHTGHMISVAIVTRFQMENKKFYDQAKELGLLRFFSDAPEQKRFWLSEWEWWVDHIDEVCSED
jgi:hypothetical protein